MKLQYTDFADRRGPSKGPYRGGRKPWLVPTAATLALLAAILGLKQMAAAPEPYATEGPEPAIASAGMAAIGPSGSTQAQTVSHRGGIGGTAFLDLQTSFRNYPEPDTFLFQGRRLVADYAWDSLLGARTELYLTRYRPEVASILVADLATGRVLASGERRDSAVSASPRLAFGGEFPAASLIKIMTATAALELGYKDVDDSLLQPGAQHTLYRRQLKTDRPERLPKITLQEAFAKSANPAFAILGMALGPEALRRCATRMGFNSTALPSSIIPSRFQIPDTGFGLAETSCGFTPKTTISPLHALEIARASGDDGRLRPCSFTRSIREAGGGAVFPGTPVSGPAFISRGNLPKLQALMEHTIRKGTARKGFHSVLRASHVQKLTLGGKTGSLDGDSEPKGRYDWFIGYAKLRESPDQGLAICVMLVHKDYMALRSSQFAALLIRDWLAAKEKAAKAVKTPSEGASVSAGGTGASKPVQAAGPARPVKSRGPA